jgi:hypothetical protein
VADGAGVGVVVGDGLALGVGVAVALGDGEGVVGDELATLAVTSGSGEVIGREQAATASSRPPAAIQPRRVMEAHASRGRANRSDAAPCRPAAKVVR